MKILIAAILLFCFFLGSQSAVYYKSQHEKPGHPKECHDTETNTFYKPGEEMIWRGNECARKLCRGSHRSTKILIEIQTCEKSIPSPNCFVSNNLKEKYPDCCRVVCPTTSEQKNNEHVNELINEKLIDEQTNFV